MPIPVFSRSIVDALHIRVFQSDFRCFKAHTWTTRDVRDPFWRFYFNFRDGAVLELPQGCDKSTLDLRGETLYFVPAGVPFSCDNRAPMEHFFAHFDVIGLPSRWLQSLFFAPIEVPHQSTLIERTRRLAETIAQSGSFDLAQQCHLKAIIWEALATHLETLPQTSRDGLWQLAAAQEPVAPALQWIEDAPGTRLSNADLARRCHLSEDYFIRRFRECVGQSPAQYALERRLAQASQLLLFSQLGIEEIARQCGFANRHSFSRAFIARIGVAPAAYRKMSRV